MALTPEGLKLVWAPYLVGCFAEGTYKVEMSWDELEGMVGEPVKALRR